MYLILEVRKQEILILCIMCFYSNDLIFNFDTLIEGICFYLFCFIFNDTIL